MNNSEVTKSKAPAPNRDPLQELREAGLYIDLFGGFCPVQCEATLQDGKALYFRARGECWELTIAATPDDAASGDNASLSISSEYGTEQFEAGYMPLETAADIILSAIALYRLSSGKGVASRQEPSSKELSL